MTPSYEQSFRKSAPVDDLPDGAKAAEAVMQMGVTGEESRSLPGRLRLGGGAGSGAAETRRRAAESGTNPVGERGADRAGDADVARAGGQGQVAAAGREAVGIDPGREGDVAAARGHQRRVGAEDDGVHLSAERISNLARLGRDLE